MGVESTMLDRLEEETGPFETGPFETGPFDTTPLDTTPLDTMLKSTADELLDQVPALEAQRREVLAGLRATPKSIHCKYLYDERGSQIFDQICELEEYYPTRTELAIMERHGAAMAAHLGPRVLLVELGAGSTVKVRHLLDHLEDPVGFVPVDISQEHLVKAAARLSEEYPDLEVLPVSADYTEDFELPRHEHGRTVVYFPGSTIGNFSPVERGDLLARAAAIAGAGGGLLIGVDLRKSREVLEAAYDDAEGVTAEFNFNLLRRFNRELGADFEREAFGYEARWNEVDGRVEMYLVSLRAQTVTVGGERIDLAAGERILTEHSHKFTIEGFAADAARAGFRLVEVWTDPQRLFSVQYYALDDTALDDTALDDTALDDTALDDTALDDSLLGDPAPTRGRDGARG